MGEQARIYPWISSLILRFESEVPMELQIAFVGNPTSKNWDLESFENCEGGRD